MNENIISEKIPQSLKELNNWVVWKFKEIVKDGQTRKTKMPMDPNTEGEASSTDPKTWSSFERALTLYNDRRTKYDGIGFVFTNTIYTGIDLDDAFSPENLERTKKIIEVCDSYTEYSPSGNGVHIIIDGKKKGKRARSGTIEIYDSGRFFTFTGKVYENYDKISSAQTALDNIYDTFFKENVTPETKQTPINYGEEKYSDEFIIDKLKNSQSKYTNPKFAELYYNGDWAKLKFPSQSEADLALCCLFAFYTKNPLQIDRLFRTSKLFREKWNRIDYSKITIENAIVKTNSTYDPNYKPNDVVLHNGYHLTENGAAYRFADEYGKDALFCKTMNKWFVFDGSRFKIDTKNKIKSFSKAMIKKMWNEIGKINDNELRKIIFKYVNSLDNNSKIDNILKLASCEPNIAVDVEELDNDPTKIVMKNGIYDLNTMELVPFSKEHKLTKQTNCEYIENAKCEKWNEHLKLIFNNDVELIECFQIAIGYTLVEGNPDQVVFLAHGSGENGKSVTLDTITKILGEYANLTNFETFAVKKVEDPHSDIAALKGVKLVIAAEAQDDKKNKFNLKNLDMQLLKRLSGGEPIKCRFLYGEWTNMNPEFKLWLMLNELPSITDNSHATWRRLQLFPFNVTIPISKKILGFDQILYKEERAGILSWIIEGYKKYRSNGKLKSCKAMEGAKSEYRVEQDILLRFVKEGLTDVKVQIIKCKECYENYLKWCTEEEIDKSSVLKKMTFFKSLRERKYVTDIKITGTDHFKVVYETQEQL